MKASIIITSFNRPHLLSLGLRSLADQSFSKDEVEVIVLNDGDPNDDTEGVCELYNEELSIRYFKAQHKTDQWRIPGFAINHGVKQSAGEFIFISCAEMYHLDNSVPMMIKALEASKKSLVIPQFGRDDNGSFLKKLKQGKEVTGNDFGSLELLHNIHLPFFMGMRKKEFVDIGGYDEDFTGVGFDDNDIVDRLKLVGNSHKRVPCRIVHLYHPRLAFNNPKTRAMVNYNNRLWVKKRGRAIRNVNREWGCKF